MQKPVALLLVAFLACRDKILPRISSALAFRHDMVKR